MDEYYREIPQPNVQNPIQNKADLQDIQIRALNRAINLLMALFKYRKLITPNETDWVNYIKNDVRLAVTIDQENLLTNFLDLASRVECPKNFDGAVALIRNHKVIGPPKSGTSMGGGVKFPSSDKELKNA